MPNLKFSRACIQDVLTAFDELKHKVIRNALRRRGLSVWAIANVMREMSGNKARFRVPAAGETDFFLLEKGLRQGAIESPDIWNWTLEDMMELELWQKDKFKVWKAEKDAEMRIKMAQSGR